jgi:PAS domain S-box-containing protein
MEDNRHSKYYIFMMGISFVFVTTALLLLIRLAIQRFLPPWHWEQIPLHVSLQTIGVFMTLTIAVLMVTLNKLKIGEPYQLWIGCALLCLGSLEGLQAMMFEVERFIWLQSLSIAIGGVLFALVWLPKHIIRRVCETHHVFVAVILTSVSAGILSLAIPLPTEAGWTWTANLLNMIGGLGFFLAAWYFVRVQSPSSVTHLLFASHCLLLGMATGLFQYAHLWNVWNATWGFWHLLRLAAYFIVLYYLIFLLRRVFTRLGKSQQQLQMLMEFAPVGIFCTDAYGRNGCINKKGVDMTGLPAAEATGKGWIKAIHPGDRKKIITQWHKTLDNHQSFKSQFRFLHKDGTIIRAAVEIVAQPTSNGKFMGYVGTLTDISETNLGKGKRGN